MKKSIRNRLVLQTTTIRTLSEDALRTVAGGYTAWTVGGLTSSYDLEKADLEKVVRTCGC